MRKIDLMAAVCRWTARVLGALIVAVLLFFMVGEGISKPFSLPLIKQLELLAMAIFMIGTLAGWRREIAGGILSLGGICLFILLIVSDTTDMGNTKLHLFYFIQLMPGALYIASSLLRRQNRKKRRP